MLNKNGKMNTMKNIWQRCKQIRTRCFFVESYYVVGYSKFLNTDPEIYGALEGPSASLSPLPSSFVLATWRSGHRIRLRNRRSGIASLLGVSFLGKTYYW
jgi:hypothetical protein